MDDTRTFFSVVMGAAGALLLSAVAFLIGLVLDLSTVLTAILMAVGVVVGAWYGLRLTRNARLGGPKTRSNHRR